MWWVHLLVRKVDSLRDRVVTLERVLCAVGRPRYVERAMHLLLQWTKGGSQVPSAVLRTLTGVLRRVNWHDGEVIMLRNGLLHRDGGPAASLPGVYESWWTHGKHVETRNFTEPYKNLIDMGFIQLF
jgi:hypothetical protein